MRYLIPANSKKSMLIFGAFTTFDLILFAVGLVTTIILLLVIAPTSLFTAILDLLPALICGFLVLPVPNYHNIRVIIQELYVFYTTRQRFIWKGWCVKDEFNESKQVHK